MKLTIIFLLLAISTHLFGKEEIKDILLLNSYHTGYNWTDRLTKGVINGFGKNSEYRIFVEYMDSKRFNDSIYFKELQRLLVHKYKSNNLNGIICADNYAFEYYLRCGDSIWNKSIPVVFCGVNNIDSISYDKDRFKGIREDIDVKNTLDVIFKLHPKTDSLILISDQSLSGKIFHQQVTRSIDKEFPNVPYRTIDATSYYELTSNLDQLDSHNKVIILLNLYSNKHKVPVEIYDFGRKMLMAKNIPIYSFWDFLLEDFIVGGSLVSAYHQGFKASKTLKLMMGGKPEIIDLSPTKHQYIFDNKLLQHYNIDESLLPPNSTIINKPVSFWTKYKYQILTVSFILIFLVITNLLMVYNIIFRRRAEKKLLDSEKRLELALNSANEGLWDISLDKKVSYINNNFAALLGYNSIDDLKITMDNWKENIFSDDIPQLNDAFQDHANNLSDVFNCEIRMLRKDKSIGWFAIYGKITEVDIDDKPQRITGVLIDINDQKEFENELTNAKNKAEESDRLKSSFLANMSHEIRTPMNAILGFSDIVTEQDLDSTEQNTYLNQIKYSAEKLLNIINDIVDISKIESGQLDIRNEVFDLKELIDSIEITGKSLLKDKPDVAIIIKKDKQLNDYNIYSDPLRLGQVLLNLLSNAVKFTCSGTITIHYFIKNNESINIEMIDTGVGIDKKHQRVIFERFRQVDNSSHTLMAGTGLGLSISKSLCTLMDGSIKVKSVENKGATFTVELPLILVKKEKHKMN